MEHTRRHVPWENGHAGNRRIVWGSRKEEEKGGKWGGGQGGRSKRERVSPLREIQLAGAVPNPLEWLRPLEYSLNLSLSSDNPHSSKGFALVGRLSILAELRRESSLIPLHCGAQVEGVEEVGGEGRGGRGGEVTRHRCQPMVDLLRPIHPPDPASPHCRTGAPALVLLLLRSLPSASSSNGPSTSLPQVRPSVSAPSAVFRVPICCSSASPVRSPPAPSSASSSRVSVYRFPLPTRLFSSRSHRPGNVIGPGWSVLCSLLL